MFTGNQDVLVEFAKLAIEYPAEPVENLWEQAGGTTTLALDSAIAVDGCPICREVDYCIHRDN